jgi:hypothetical protein
VLNANLKGIDMLLKTVNKKYPYIVGWEFTDNEPNRFSTIVGIDIVVDVDKLSDYFKVPVFEYYMDYEFMRRGYSLCGPLKYLSMDNFEDRPCFKDYFELKKLLNKYHRYLPKEYKFYTKMKVNGELDPEYMGRVDIDVNKIKFVRDEE